MTEKVEDELMNGYLSVKLNPQFPSSDLLPQQNFSQSRILSQFSGPSSQCRVIQYDFVPRHIGKTVLKPTPYIEMSKYSDRVLIRDKNSPPLREVDCETKWSKTEGVVLAPSYSTLTPWVVNDSPC